MKIGLIGYGYWGKHYARIFTSYPQSLLATIVDQDVSHRQLAQQRYPNVSVSATLDGLSNVDAVVIVTPPQTHYALARWALTRGKHVLLEKPATTDLHHIVELYRLAHQNHVTLMISEPFLFSPEFSRLKEMIHKGALGSVRYMESIRTHGLARCDVDVIWDFMPHDLGIAAYLLGVESPTAIKRLTMSSQNLTTDVASIYLHYSTYTYSVYLNWRSPVKRRQLAIVGTTGYALYDATATDGTLKFTCDHDAPLQSMSFSGHEPLKTMCDQFLALLHRGETPADQERRTVEGIAILTQISPLPPSLPSREASSIINFREGRRRR
ncbi:MAG: hypothetical protein C7B47_16125 [Sulfobacillus thermosulfidooxidans]|uniref:Gfo/Idh/MocA-like oxidoreductase N-terminal domain-containing protein n=1 Tax=Sulfobacillus thermosulfidooxidans TaxID=28034 RepID=A0A2T2WLK1_SULTH|nr:MAG: hypothetical protein C7B47_16125 [Sulfobacillus thermosulfidooxidans]